MERIVEKEFVSSEESEYEEIQENGAVVRRLKGFKVRKLPWERKKMKTLKKKLDEAYLGSLTKHARGMFKDRVNGVDSTRPCPDGPDWAVRK